MLIPTKHEKLSENLLVIGAQLIEILKKESCTAEYLFICLLKDQKIQIGRFYDALTFLWLSEILDIQENVIFLREYNETT